MWTGRATSCSNTVRQHGEATRCCNKLLRVYWRIFGKIFVSAMEFCRCNKLQKIKSDWICVTCYSDKILLQRQRFSQKFSSTHEAICCCDVSLHHVAATCRLECTDLKRKENEITTAVSRTYENATHIIAWFALGVVTRERKCPLIVSFCFQFLSWSLFWFKTLCLTRC